MERMSRTLLTAFLLSLSAMTIAWCQGDVKAAFEAANAAYSEGDYEAAISGYKSILEERMHFESEYNLGNAYYKSGDWGPAILHYERAALLSPSNEDVRTNLVLANAQIKDRIESLPSNGITDIWERITAPGRFQLWARIMLFGWTLGFVALAWRLWAKGVENRRLLGSSAGVLLVMGLSSMLLTRTSAKRIESSKTAIVMAMESAVRNEPGYEGMTLFMLHEGTKVTVTDRSSAHWKIQLANGNTGWIAASDLTEI